MRKSFIKLMELGKNPYSEIIGYPRAPKNQINSRINELKKLGISGIKFEGPTKIGKLEVLGKGYTGVVVIAKKNQKKVALKIRRLDSPRKNMNDEALLLRKANSVLVGPKVFDKSKNFLVMEILDGIKISDWISSQKGHGSAKRVRSVIRNILEDCYLLDKLGLDHGELSCISKHVLVGSKITIIDFESSSTKRKVSNVTSASQALLIGSGISKNIQKIIKIPPKQDIIEVLREYKKNTSRESFEELMKILKI